MSALDRKAIILSFVLLLLFISATKISDYDFWWHLKLGETVYNTGSIYKVDEFTYTFNGHPQFNGEWLADLVLYLSYKAGGFFGVYSLKAALLFFTFLFLFLALKNMWKDETAGFYAAVITLVTVLFSIRFRLFIRPYLFSYMFFSIFLFLISHYEKNRKIKMLYFLPALEIIWANTSKGAFYGPLLLAIFIVGDAFKNKAGIKLITLLLILTAVSFLNPSTHMIYSLPFRVFSSAEIKDAVGEHQPISLGLLFNYGFRYTFGYQMLVAGSLIYLIFLRGWKNVYHLILFAVFFVQSLTMIRMIDFFSLSAVILCLSPVEKFLEIFRNSIISRKVLLSAILSLLMLGLIPLSVVGGRTYIFGTGTKDNTFPEEAIKFIEREKISGTLYNSYPFGGYLIWRSPERKVFIDGRGIGALYSNDFYNKYFESLKNADAWMLAEREWNFDYAVIEYDLIGRHFPKHINENPDWALVYWNNHSAVYLKRIEKNLDIIRDHEYKITKPGFNDFSYLQQYLHSGNAHAAIEQINREISMNPENQEPRLAKAFLLYNMGSFYHDEALKELEICLKLKPDLSAEHSAIAFILINKGLIDKAKDEIKKASRINPDDPGAVYLKERFK